MTSPSGHHRSACCGWGCSENSGLADPRPDELSLPIWRRLPVHLSYHSRRSSVPSSYRRFDQLHFRNVWPSKDGDGTQQSARHNCNEEGRVNRQRLELLHQNSLSSKICSSFFSRTPTSHRWRKEIWHLPRPLKQIRLIWAKISTWIRQLLNAGHFRVSHSLWWR